MNPAMLKNAGVTDPGDPVGVKKASVAAEEVVGAEGKYILLFFSFTGSLSEFCTTFFLSIPWVF
jgi:hypothetical protein